MDFEIEVEFSQLEQEMDVEFEQSDMEMEADFGELQTVNIGLSAYQVAVKNGFEGTEEEWLSSLQGEPGHTPVKGKDYFTEKDKQEMVSEVLAALPVYDGAYSVTPSADEEQILETAQTYVNADIKISKIPYNEVSNNSGGTTVTIGG